MKGDFGSEGFAFVCNTGIVLRDVGERTKEIRLQV